MKKKSIIIHHNDMDGRAAAVIAAVSEFDRENGVEFYETNYGDPVPLPEVTSGFDRVIIVDFTPPQKEILSYLKEKYQSNLIWIDHHVSAIKANMEHSDIKGIRMVGYSGAELSAIYVNSDYTINIHSADKISSKDEITFKMLLKPLPIIRMIGDRDVWRNTNKEAFTRASNFKYGMDLHWNTEWNLDGETDDNYYRWCEILFAKSYDEQNIDSIIKMGEIVTQYNDAIFSKWVEYNAYPVRIHKFEDLDAIAINASIHSSDVFKSVYDDYEVGVCYTHTGKSMNFSVYRLGENPEKKIDVSTIAYSYGGGGHAGAAGFKTSGVLPFV